MIAPQEDRPKSEPQDSTRSLTPISAIETAGVFVLLTNDAWFLATLGSPHIAWYVLNVSLYVIWLIVTLVVLKYRWPNTLNEYRIMPPSEDSAESGAWLGWRNLAIISIGALFIHPAITGILAAFRWRGPEYLKARQANLIALLVFAGYSLYSLLNLWTRW